MSEMIKAVYENGTLVLEEPLKITNGSKVEVLIVENGQSNKQSAAEILAEIAALPIEGKTDPFSGRDHDTILYGEGRAR